MIMRNRILLAGAVLATVFGTNATDIDFTYNTEGLESKVYGFNKKETYDVAIRINDPSYVGSKVAGFTVDLPVGAGAIDNVSGWLASELKLVDKKNAPDLATKTAQVVDEMLSVTFDAPCTIPADGIWVGYSFNITALGEEYHWPGSPIACIESDANLDNGLWVHASRSRLKWTNLASSLGAVSTMTVHLATDFGPYDAAVSVPEQSYMKAGEVYNVPVMVINHGSSPLEDIEYTYSVGDADFTGSVHLDTPIGALGKTGVVEFPMGPVEKTGEYPFILTLGKSNGELNDDPNRTGRGVMNVWPIIPVTRPLVEEFTGLRCGYCPRGYVAMEWMKENFGDLFVGMAYHASSYEADAMECVQESEFPIYVGGYPDGDFNRKDEMDPSYLPFRWDGYAAEIAPADIEVSMDWADSDKKEAVMTSSVTFAKDVENAGYRLAFALVADGLKNDKWAQSNYYAGDDEGDGVDSPLWDVFLTGGKTVKGLTFNDVVVYMKEVDGIEGSVPATIKAGEAMKYEYRVPMADVKNLKGHYFINEGASVHAVAILLDAETGYAVNCNKSVNLAYSNAESGILSLIHISEPTRP